jgi:hypothetical protein
MLRRAIVFLLGLALLVALPWVFRYSFIWGTAAAIALVCWIIWLVVDYLRWARGIGKRS